MTIKDKLTRYRSLLAYYIRKDGSIPIFIRNNKTYSNLKDLWKVADSLIVLPFPLVRIARSNVDIDGRLSEADREEVVFALSAYNIRLEGL